MDHDGQGGPKSAAGLAFGRLKDLLHQEVGAHDRRFKGALSGMHAVLMVRNMPDGLLGGSGSKRAPTRSLGRE
jgi:hypothetical protein